MFGGLFGTTETFRRKIQKNLRVANPVDIVTHLPLLVPTPPVSPTPFFHVQGGLLIAANLKNFHSLEPTYLDGILEKLVSVPQGGVVDLLGAEDAVLVEQYQHDVKPPVPVEAT